MDSFLFRTVTTRIEITTAAAAIFQTVSISKLKQPFDQSKQFRNSLHHDHQHHHKACQSHNCGHFIPSGTGEYLIQYGNNDPNCCNFKNQIDIQMPTVLCVFYKSTIAQIADIATATLIQLRLRSSNLLSLRIRSSRTSSVSLQRILS